MKRLNRANAVISKLYLCMYMYIYRVFTGNCGKVTYYISGSITHTFLQCLHQDYHSWTYITTNFQCPFDIKCNCFYKRIPQAFHLVTTSASSQSRLLQLSTDFWPPVTSLLLSFQVLSGPPLQLLKIYED